VEVNKKDQSRETWSNEESKYEQMQCKKKCEVEMSKMKEAVVFK